MKKRLFSNRSIAPFLFLLMSVPSWAYDFMSNGIYYNINSDGTSVTVTYKSSSEKEYSGSVVLPSTVISGSTTYNVTHIGNAAFYDCPGLTSITIPESVKNIGEAAFKNSGLTSVTIPGSVVSIEYQAFQNCTSLATVTICEGVTKIGLEVFRGCTSLAEIRIPKTVTSIGDHFLQDCPGTVYINCNVPGCEVTNGDIFAESFIVGAFAGCKATEVIIGKDVKKIGTMPFTFGPKLTSLTVEAGNTVFDSRDNCNAVIKTSTNQLVVGCANTTIPNDVTSIGDNVFSYCEMATIGIPNSVVSIGKRAFYESGIMTITLPQQLRNIGTAAFWRCTKLTNVTFPDNIKQIVYEDDNVPYTEGQLTVGDIVFQNCTSLPVENNLRYAGNYLVEAVNKDATNYTIKSNTKYIGPSAFSYCHEMISLTIPDGVTSICYNAFNSCTNLQSMDIPESVTTIGSSSFSYCTNLRYVIIPEEVTTIGEWTFNGCTNLTSVICKAEQVPAVKYSSFRNVPQNRGTLGVPASALDAYSSADYWKDFGTILPLGSSLTTSLTLNKTSATIDNGSQFQLIATVAPENAFQHVVWTSSDNDVALVDVNGLVNAVGAGTAVITAATIDGTNRYAQCEITVTDGESVLLSDKYGDNVQFILYKDGSLVFMGSGGIPYSDDMPWNDYCDLIVSVTIPESITYIESKTFASCPNLTKVTVNSNTVFNNQTFSPRLKQGMKWIFGEQVEEYILGDAIRQIGSYAFYGCTHLTSVTCMANTVPTTGDYTFGEDDEALRTKTLYVPALVLDAYKAAYPWKYFGNILPIGGNTRVHSIGTSGKNFDMYDLGGLKRAHIQRGLNILRMNDGTTKKVMVK